MKRDLYDRMAFTSPMTEVAQILATGLLRLRHSEMDRQPRAADVSEKGLDVSAEKSVNVTTRLHKKRADEELR